jgi:calcineurin-like phosphoesterase family protein
MAQSVFFTADTHFGHRNVINYSKRPFRDIEEMDEALIANWNAVIRPGDLVYHLGDFALCDVERATKIVARLVGQKYLVFGNHDKVLRKHKPFLGHWVWQRELTSITVENQKIVLCHFAMLTWESSHHGTWQLHGHSHGSLPDNPRARRLDVGVDCWGQHPVSFETIKQKMANKIFVAVDHHDD